MLPHFLRYSLFFFPSGLLRGNVYIFFCFVINLCISFCHLYSQKYSAFDFLSNIIYADKSYSSVSVLRKTLLRLHSLLHQVLQLGSICPSLDYKLSTYRECNSPLKIRLSWKPEMVYSFMII